MELKLAEKFKPYLDNPIFVEVLRLVRENSKGKIWLMGGFLYRNLVRELYEPTREIYTADIDFFVEERSDMLKNVSGWSKYTNSYGAENYMNGKTKISFSELKKAIRESGKSPKTIEELLKEVPFTIQSMAYDLDENKLIDEGGIEALLSKSIGINDKIQAEFYARQHNTSVKEMLETKSKELNFDFLI